MYVTQLQESNKQRNFYYQHFIESTNAVNLLTTDHNVLKDQLDMAEKERQEFQRQADLYLADTHNKEDVIVGMQNHINLLNIMCAQKEGPDSNSSTLLDGINPNFDDDSDSLSASGMMNINALEQRYYELGHYKQHISHIQFVQCQRKIREEKNSVMQLTSKVEEVQLEARLKD